MKSLCKEAFKNGLKDRENHPLPSGIYKLKDVHSWWNKQLASLEKIKDYKRGIGEPYSLMMPCMSDEIPKWLKGQPENLARDIGYCIYPAVSALKGDGLKQWEIDRIINWRLEDFYHLLDDAEALRIRINKDIYYEIDNFKLNRSELIELYRQAMDILCDIFEDIEEFKGPLDEDTENFQNEVLV